VRPRFAWKVVAEPLVEFCRQPARAADLVGQLGPAELRVPFPAPELERSRAERAVRLFVRSMRDDGVVTTAGRVVRKLLGRVRRRAAQ
jgi:hypothetical protein